VFSVFSCPLLPDEHPDVSSRFGCRLKTILAPARDVSFKSVVCPFPRHPDSLAGPLGLIPKSFFRGFFSPLIGLIVEFSLRSPPYSRVVVAPRSSILGSLSIPVSTAFSSIALPPVLVAFARTPRSFSADHCWIVSSPLSPRLSLFPFLSTTKNKKKLSTILPFRRGFSRHC
jgi:hypothetical protein